jgi:endonuclease/exonuclease/phosphatase (EEP) superfamily protein YafD
VFVADFTRIHDIIFLVLLSVNEVYLLSLIWNYTPLAGRQMKGDPENSTDKIRLFIANVYQYNCDYSLCYKVITQARPDIVLLVETDEEWATEMEEMMNNFKYKVLQPQPDTYGMMLFSKLEIVHHNLRFLVEENVPSITADIKTKNNQQFRLYCVHPKPPVPGESKESTERDAEILIVGKEAKAFSHPVIVAGDLNDVAWSYTTKLFIKISGLLDPRIGRGFYSTFHAKYPIFRWPLDHVFCSSHFYLNHLKRMPSIGSDHFPMLIEVSLMPEEIDENVEEKMEADSDDHELAEEKIEAAM